MTFYVNVDWNILHKKINEIEDMKRIRKSYFGSSEAEYSVGSLGATRRGYGDNLPAIWEVCDAFLSKVL